MKNPSRRGLLGGFALLASAPAVTAKAAPGPVKSPDAELLDLGQQLKIAWAVEDAFFADRGKTDDECDAAVEPCHDLVERIGVATAHTIEGLRVKAQAVWWCARDGSNFDFAQFIAKAETTDNRVMATIVRDLICIGSSS